MFSLIPGWHGWQERRGHGTAKVTARGGGDQRPRAGNVGVVSLDANDVSFEIPANNGYTGGAQVTWLGATLASLRKQPGIDFIVAYFHHCAYCTCAVHGSEGARGSSSFRCLILAALTWSSTVTTTSTSVRIRSAAGR